MLILPDDLFEYQELVLRQMLEIYEQYNSNVISLRRVSEDQISRYGIVDPRKVDKNMYELRGVIEKPSPDKAPSNLAIMGRYILMINYETRDKWTDGLIFRVHCKSRRKNHATIGFY